MLTRPCDNGELQCCDNSELQCCDNSESQHCDNGESQHCDNGELLRCDNGESLCCDSGESRCCDNGESMCYSSQLRSPGLVTMVKEKNKTLYMSTVKSIEDATKPNLKKTLQGLLQLKKLLFDF